VAVDIETDEVEEVEIESDDATEEVDDEVETEEAEKVTIETD
jgi:hypothetical protein